GYSGRSVECAAGAAPLGRVGGVRVWQATASSLRGAALAWLGRIDDALPDLERGPQLYETAGGRASLAFFYLRWAEGLFLARHMEARQIAERALDLAVTNGERGNEALALHVLAEIHARGSVESAEGYYRRALALAIELTMRPLIARCHLGLGRLYRHCGNAELAREHLTDARTLLRELDMQFWLAQTGTEFAALA